MLWSLVLCSMVVIRTAFVATSVDMCCALICFDRRFFCFGVESSQPSLFGDVLLCSHISGWELEGRRFSRLGVRASPCGVCFGRPCVVPMEMLDRSLLLRLLSRCWHLIYVYHGWSFVNVIKMLFPAALLSSWLSRVPATFALCPNE